MLGQDSIGKFGEQWSIWFFQGEYYGVVIGSLNLFNRFEVGSPYSLIIRMLDKFRKCTLRLQK